MTTKTFDFYKQREGELIAANNRVNNILQDFETGKRNDVDNWNKAHDLQYRIENRLKDNYSDYLGYCFNTYGFCAINF